MNHKASFASGLVAGVSLCVAVMSFMTNPRADTTMHAVSNPEGSEPALLVPSTAANSATGKLFSGAKIRRYTDNRVQFEHKASNGTRALGQPTALTCKQWSVVTTIFEPSPSIIATAALSDWCMVIVADRKTDMRPYHANAAFTAGNVVLLDVSSQQQMAEHWEFVRMSPWNHFARKNIGYLYAISHGAEFIFDFDDDNLLKEGLGPMPTDGAKLRDVQLLSATETVGNISLLNPYPLMGAPEADTWPRGFPLEQIRNNGTTGTVVLNTQDVELNSVAVIQSLADHDPDVDAIYRLTRKVPFDFGIDNTHPVALPPTSYSPYNAQATVHARQAFWAMLLPRTVPGRVSDIWRSYFSEKIFGILGLSVVFVPPRVTQFRNAHNYLAGKD